LWTCFLIVGLFFFYNRCSFSGSDSLSIILGQDYLLSLEVDRVEMILIVSFDFEQLEGTEPFWEITPMQN
jgi:hypothetical protein